MTPQAHTHEHPMTDAQQRLWFLHTLDPGDATYNMPVVQLLRGSIDPELIDRALREVARRHEILRTTYAESGGRGVQRVAADTTVRCTFSDLSDAAQPRERARTLAAELALTPFDLALEQPLRAILLRTGRDEHVLAVVTHHIAADGWSANILLAELTAAYATLRDGGDTGALPRLPLQFGAFARDEQRAAESRASSGEPDPALTYWTTRLDGAPLLELPLDHPRPPVRTGRGGRAEFPVAAELADKVAELARRARTTPFTVFLAAYQVLLTGHSGQEEVCVGVPLAGRERPELRDLIGYFANTVVLRGDTGGTTSVQELLAATRRATLEAMAHQELPIERLLAELRIPRDRSRTPLFQAWFALQNQDDPRSAWRALGVVVDPFDLGPLPAKYELTLFLWPGADGSLRGELLYDADLFEASSIAAMGRRYLALLDRFTQAPERTVAELELAAPDERELLTALATGPTAPIPDLSLVDLFHQVCDRTPEAVAVVDGPTRVSYRELDRRASAVAERLVALGVVPGDLVGVCLHRSADLLATLLGIFQAGGTYVPLDPAYPAERLALISSDAGTTVTVTTRELQQVVPPDAGAALLLDELAATADAQDAHDAQDAPTARLALARPEHVAYVIYTSGSTGRPKGVDVTQRNVVNFLMGMEQRLGGPPASTLALSSFSFDISVLEMFLPLTRGGLVVVADEATRRDGARLLRLVRDHRISLVQATPTSWRMMLAAGFDEPWVTAVTGGEPLPETLAPRLRAAVGRLVNAWGPTETTVYSSWWDVPEDIAERTIGIGDPLVNQTMHVLDRHGRLAPFGVPGEVFVGGAGVADGYRGRPELTTERFLPDPFDGGLMYRTGDVVVRHRDGTLAFLGRTDNQVKIRGHRIELGEVEACLARHPAVGQAVVAVRPDATGFPSLAAYAVPLPGAVITAAALREHLEQHLPAAMLPSTITLLETLPSTPNRKLDRAALPDPVLPAAGTAAEVFRTPLEELVGKVCATVLGLPGPGTLAPDDDLFDFGAHSLSVMEIVAAVREEWDVELPVELFFDTPTVRAIAARIQDESGEPGAAH